MSCSVRNLDASGGWNVIPVGACSTRRSLQEVKIWLVKKLPSEQVFNEEVSTRWRKLQMIKAGVISMECWILNLKGFPRLFGDNGF